MARVWLALGLAGCVSSGSYDAAVAERDALQSQVAQLKDEVAALEGKSASCESDLRTAQARVEQLDSAAREERLTKTREQLGLERGQTLHATFHTRVGKISCELWPDVAPVTVANFVGLAEGTREWTDPRTGKKRTDPLYPGTVFHRVIPEFMIQGGDPLGTGTGGPGYEFEDEVRRDVKFDQPGLLAMANAGPGTNGSQFFITDSQPSHLNMKHTIFGKCDLDTVRKIMAEPLQRSGRGEASKPENPVAIDRLVIERR